MERIKQLYKNGFFHIFGGSVFSQIGSFVVSMVVTRMLPKGEYGQYVSAHNIYGYIYLFMGLGFISGILQFCSEQRSDREKLLYYNFSKIGGTIVNVILFVLVIVIAFVIYQTQPLKGILLATMGPMPIITYFETINLTILRVEKKNKFFAWINIVKTIVSVISNIVITRFIGVYGLVISVYVSEMISFLITQIHINKSHSLVKVEGSLRTDAKRAFLKFSIVCCITNMTSSILILLDVTCIDIVINNPEVTASYKIASTIPTALMFIPSSYITYIYPYFAESSGDYEVLKKLMLKSIMFMVLINLFLSATIIIFAPAIVRVIWGDKYADAADVLRVLTINYFIFGSFRKILGNVVLVLKKVWINFFVTFFSGILNVVLNIILIKNYQSIGAAFATVIVTIVVTLFTLIYLTWYGKNNKKNIKTGENNK